MGQQTVTTQFNQSFPGVDGDTMIVGDNYISGYSAETTLNMPWGAFLAHVPAAADDAYVVMKANTTRTFAGILVFQDVFPLNYQFSQIPDANGNTGVMPGAPIKIKIRGSIWVQTDEAVTVEDAVRIRLNNTGAGVGPGIGRKTAVGGQTVNISGFAKWLGTYAAGQAKLRVDATIGGTATND